MLAWSGLGANFGPCVLNLGQAHPKDMGEGGGVTASRWLLLGCQQFGLGRALSLLGSAPQPWRYILLCLYSTPGIWMSRWVYGFSFWL